jgi:hypothetical protein
VVAPSRCKGRTLVQGLCPRKVNLSPGLTYALTPKTRVYGFLQKPLRQYVNTDPADPASGQLTAPWSMAMGVNHLF